jgi:hypothetical protein
MRTLTACATTKGRGAALSRRFAILIAIFFAVNLVVLAQSLPSGHTMGSLQSGPLRTHHKSKGPSSLSLLTPLKLETLEVPYQSFTPRQYLRWFTTNTMDPANLAGGVCAAALGTAPARPKEYGPHWGGFADRYGMGMTGSVTGNAIEAGVGLILREDPRYFRVPDRPFKARVGNVVRLTFGSRGDHGGFGPAYARYMGLFGNNLISNSWRAHSEANSHDALLRTSEGFGGLLAGNAFEEFWPDVKRRVFHKHH